MEREHGYAARDGEDNQVFVQWIPLLEDGDVEEHDG